MPVTYDDILAAQRRIAGAIDDSPCPESIALSELTGCRVFCKLEMLQHTGSFKERGAANAVTRLVESEQGEACPGVIAASAGNHAQALAYHGRRLGLPVVVVMPRFAPLIKAETCRRLGADVVLHGEGFDEARRHADALAQQRGLTYVHGFDDPDVIAGQGTLGLELLEQAPEMEAVVVPIGGGGLIAGAALAIKHVRPEVEVIGVEPARMPCYIRALEHGGPVDIPVQSTLADGLAVGRVGANAFALSRDLVDRVVQVAEADLALAVLRLTELEKAVVEGAGAAPLAALLAGKLPELRGKTVVLPLCGGNIDPIALRRVIEHGLAADGRLHRIDLMSSDRPGGLARLSGLIAEEGASIQDIRHDRVFAGPDLATVGLNLVLETRNREHFEQVVARLRADGFRVGSG